MISFIQGSFSELKFGLTKPLDIGNEHNSYEVKNSKKFQQAIKMFEAS